MSQSFKLEATERVQFELQCLHAILVCRIPMLLDEVVTGDGYVRLLFPTSVPGRRNAAHRLTHPPNGDAKNDVGQCSSNLQHPQGARSSSAKSHPGQLRTYYRSFLSTDSSDRDDTLKGAFAVVPQDDAVLIFEHRIRRANSEAASMLRYSVCDYVGGSIR